MTLSLSSKIRIYIESTDNIICSPTAISAIALSLSQINLSALLFWDFINLLIDIEVWDQNYDTHIYMVTCRYYTVTEVPPSFSTFTTLIYDTEW